MDYNRDPNSKAFKGTGFTNPGSTLGSQVDFLGAHWPVAVPSPSCRF